MSNYAHYGPSLETPLTTQQQRFVREYIIDFNGAKAARRAGFTSEFAANTAWKLLQSPKIQDAIKKEQQKLADKMGITPERIIQELALIGFANIKDYVTKDEDGRTTIDIDSLDRDTTAALDIQIEISEGKSRSTNTKIKLANKVEALLQMGKHLGMFKEQVDHNVTLTLEQLVNESLKVKTVEPKVIEYQSTGGVLDEAPSLGALETTK